jgi:hypothetical protein
VVRSLPYDPDVVDEDPSPPIEFDVLDFFFNFAGQTAVSVSCRNRAPSDCLGWD